MAIASASQIRILRRLQYGNNAMELRIAKIAHPLIVFVHLDNRYNLHLISAQKKAVVRMAFRMAKGSLFSVLLRSPWWYSSLIALFLLAITVLAFGGKFLIFGLTAALPFIGISGYTAIQQMKRPPKSRVLEVTQQAREMPAREVAVKIADTYKTERYDAAPHKGNTANIELTRGSKILLLSTKRFKAATTGIDPLKQLVAAGEKIEATGYLYVALGSLSPNALEYAKKENIEIIEGEALASLFDGKILIQK